MWTTRNRLLALYRECECEAAREAIVGLGMLALVPAKLEQDVARENIVSTIVTRSESRSVSVAKSWNEQRQAEAMIGHNVARDFDNDLHNAAARIKTQLLIVLGTDDRVVTPEPAREFAKLVDANVLELDEDCGHGELGCAPETFADAVRTFIDSD